MTQIEKRILKIMPAIKFLLTIVLGLLIASCITGFDKQSNTPINQQPEEEIYIVQDGDTLWSIASEYMDKNTYGKREIREFKEGIIQENYKKYPDIKSGLIRKNDRLVIHYWIKKEVTQNE